MTVQERLMGTGRWDLSFKPDTPQTILSAVDVKRRGNGFGHIVITPIPINLEAVTADADRLTFSRYIGVLRDRRSELSIGGPGLAMWLGDEDGKGKILEQDDYGTTLSDWRTLLTPPGFTGSGASMAGPFTRDVIRETAIEVLPDVCSFFGVEWKIGYIAGAWRLQIDTPANLFRTVPVAMIFRDAGGNMRDLDVLGIGGGYEIEQDLDDWTLDLRYYFGDEAAPSVTIASEGGLQLKDVPYRRVDGQAITMTRVIEDFNSTSVGSGPAMAAAQFGRFARAYEAITAVSTEYNITPEVRAGDYVWIYDPPRGLVSTVNEVYFRGRLYRPLRIRVAGHTWPIREGMGVYFRRYKDTDTNTWDIEWVDLTEWINWENGTAEQVELGDLPRSVIRRVRRKTIKETVRYTDASVTE